MSCLSRLEALALHLEHQRSLCGKCGAGLSGVPKEVLPAWEASVGLQIGPQGSLSRQPQREGDETSADAQPDQSKWFPP